MLSLPIEIIGVLQPFAPAFRRCIWEWAKVLLVGAILAPGGRTVTAVLRVVGLSHERHFANYRRVLNLDHWSSRTLSRTLLGLLLRAFVPADAPVVVGIDETIERRRGVKIAAKGIYRDPVRTSKEHFVKTSGLRWISLQLLAPIPWAQRVWGLPFLTVLAPSKRYHQKRGRRHKTITDWGRQMLLQVRRWLPERTLIVVADSTYAVLDLLARCQRLPRPITVVTRLRLDAAVYNPAPPRPAGTKGRPRRKGTRRPTLQTRVGDQELEARAISSGGSRVAKILVDNHNSLGWPTEPEGSVAERTLPRRAFRILDHLLERALADVQAGEPLQMLEIDRLGHHDGSSQLRSDNSLHRERRSRNA